MSRKIEVTRLPSETVTRTLFNPATQQQETYTYALDEGRMPTQRGKGGIVADRSVTRNVMTDPSKVPLFQKYMLAKLRNPEYGEEYAEYLDALEGSSPADENDRPEPFGFWVLSLNDLQYFRQFEEATPRKARHAHRYEIELWDASPDDENGDPERDSSWEANNPVAGFVALGLSEGRAMTECLASLLARGKYHPDLSYRSVNEVMSEHAKRSTRFAPTYQRLLARDPAHAARWNEEKGAALNRWMLSYTVKYLAPTTRAMQRAAEEQRKKDAPQQQRNQRQRRLARALKAQQEKAARLSRRIYFKVAGPEQPVQDLTFAHSQGFSIVDVER